jgi:hypothetical protein
MQTQRTNQTGERQDEDPGQEFRNEHVSDGFPDHVRFPYRLLYAKVFSSGCEPGTSEAEIGLPNVV